MSLRGRCGFGGIGTGPQTPDAAVLDLLRRAWRLRPRRPCTWPRRPCKRGRRSSCRSSGRLRSRPSSSSPRRRRCRARHWRNRPRRARRRRACRWLHANLQVVREEQSGQRNSGGDSTGSGGRAARDVHRLRSRRRSTSTRVRARPRQVVIGGRQCVPRHTHATAPRGRGAALDERCRQSAPGDVEHADATAGSVPLERALPLPRRSRASPASSTEVGGVSAVLERASSSDE